MKEDVINEPKHYKLKNGKESLDYIKLVTKYVPNEIAYSLGNAIKYLSRATEKESFTRDLGKAEYYLKDCISEMSGGYNTTLYTKIYNTKPNDIGVEVSDFILMVMHKYTSKGQKYNTIIPVMYSTLSCLPLLFNQKNKPKTDYVITVLQEMQEGVADCLTMAKRISELS